MLFPIYFISWIVVGMVALALFDENTGIINSAISALGGTPVEWYSNADYWWPIMIITTIWKNAGYGSIIYFCALTGFDQSLYEAAEIDGASPVAENQADYAAAVKAYHYNYVSAEYWGHSGGRSGSDYGHDQPEPAAVGKNGYHCHLCISVGNRKRAV